MRYQVRNMVGLLLKVGQGKIEKEKEMSDTFKIKFDFMEKWGRFAKAEYLQIYLFRQLLLQLK